MIPEDLNEVLDGNFNLQLLKAISPIKIMRIENQFNDINSKIMKI